MPLVSQPLKHSTYNGSQTINSSNVIINVVCRSPAIPVFESTPSLSPLYQLIVQSQLQLQEENGSPPLAPHNMHFYSVGHHLTDLHWPK